MHEFFEIFIVLGVFVFVVLLCMCDVLCYVFFGMLFIAAARFFESCKRIF